MNANTIYSSYKSFIALSHLNQLEEINTHNLGVEKYHGFYSHKQLFDPKVLNTFSQATTSHCLNVLYSVVDATQEHVKHIKPQDIQAVVSDPKTNPQTVAGLQHFFAIINLLKADRTVTSKKLHTRQSFMTVVSGPAAWSKLVPGPEDMVSNMKTASGGRYPVQTFISDKMFAFTLSQAIQEQFGEHITNIHKMTQEQQEKVLHPVWKHVLDATGTDVSGNYKSDATNALRTIHRTARTISLYHILKHLKDQIIHSDIPDVSENYKP
jgi:hypothetical protein